MPDETTQAAEPPEDGASGKTTHAFEADVDRLLRLVIDSLYSNKEVFLRELVSNASDALDKLRFRALTEAGLLDAGETLAIRLSADREAGTLTVDDNGVGMTHDELVRHLGTIAHSGTRAFLESLKEQGKNDASLIGQFGVGFYSAFLVADRVEVVSRAAGEGQPAYRWQSEAHGSFTVETAERETRGTSVTLHLKPDQRHLLEGYALRSLVTKYSDYVAFPILLREGEGGEAAWQQINRATALWQRTPSEITAEQYDEFYQHLTHDAGKPLARAHVRVEGTHEFAGILYVPASVPPGGVGHHDDAAGVSLFVKRVFILASAPELLPPWLRFVRGVVDSDDLPLNVSRELLQDSSEVRVIRKQLTKKVLDALEGAAASDAGAYASFWKSGFGVVLKEGLATDFEFRDRLAKLARFSSTRVGDSLTSLGEYVEKMPLRQKAIYYALGPSLEALRAGPYLEALTKRGFEVLLLTDPIDEWAVEGLPTFDDKPLVSAMRADLELEPVDEAEAPPAEIGPLTKALREKLGSKVGDVRVSSRLTDSPCCLVVPAGALHATTERILRAAGQKVPEVGRVLEINPRHPLVERVAELARRSPESPEIGTWAELLYDQAVLLEGGRLDEPARFVKRLNELLSGAPAAPAVVEGGPGSTP